MRLIGRLLPFLLIPLLTGTMLDLAGEAAAEIKTGGVLRVPLTGEIRSLDPARVGDTASGLVARQIYEGLVEFDGDLSIRPALAEWWDVSEDGLVWTFRLREGARFQDDECFPGGKGRELTAEDVKYSFERIVRPSTLSTGWWLFNGKIKGANEYREALAKSARADREPALKGVEGFRALDDRTFQIELTKPFAPFINLLAMSYTWVVPREAVEHYGEDFFRNPVGTGPFRLKEWSPGLKVVLKRNPNYWGKDEEGRRLPYLDEIEIRLLRDSLMAFLEFDRGNLDSSGIPPEMWLKVMKDKETPRRPYDKYHLKVSPSLSVQYYGFMMGKEPLGTSKLLRQAFNYAINREAIIKYVQNGRGIPAKGPIPPGIYGYDETAQGYTYDPEKAKALLEAAGYPGGKGLPDIVLQLNSGGTENEDIAAAIQGQLAEIGVKINLMLIAWPQHLESIDRGTPLFFRLGWIADYPDPENFLALLYSKNFAPAGPNSTRFQNEEFDRLFEQALHSTDPEERIRLYREAERIVIEEAPWLFLSYGEAYRLEQPYVRNYSLNPMGINILKVVWLDK